MRLEELSGDRLQGWDEFVQSSVNGTMFHERRFLSYHGERFQGTERFLIMERRGRPYAGIALAVREQDGERVALSPYGASYGGVLFAQNPDYRRAHEVAQLLLSYLRDQGVQHCRLTPTVGYVPSVGANTGVFALLESGFRCINRDISSVVYLDPRTPLDSRVSSRVRRAARRARAGGVEVERDAALDTFWPVLEANFERHDSAPTHERDELEDLLQRMAGRIRLWTARVAGKAVAGIALFRLRDDVEMTFYLCQNPAARHTQALSLLLLELLEAARDQGRLCVDLGTSSVNMRARPGVFEFKENFTRTGQFRDTLEWSSTDGHGS